ncbi:hypothetical protein HHK36_007300 [Tetracentron sinense]|uniref:Uncharacterized protein n=1 Tax=Tetracentron sinense TaxID=13715 RepID=A0A834ZN55_TETSI|nr:hypothetical protein HHK36_007300 [Tetracentron sinense]
MSGSCAKTMASFVYKRKKRRQDSTALATPSALPPDPEAEERQRREQKKRTLMNLRDQYQKEIHHWEFLSNTLREIQEKTHQQQQEQQQHPSSLSSTKLPLLQLQTPDSFCRPLFDELLLQYLQNNKKLQWIVLLTTI